jgi:Ca2+-binding RTX toxin-like protein
LTTGRLSTFSAKKALTDAVQKFGGVTKSTIDDAVRRYWQDKTDNLIKLVAATQDVAVNLDAVTDAQIGQQPNPLPTDGAMLVGAGADDTLTGSSGNDLLIGGKGKDTLVGGRGDDLLFGGADDDTFQGYDAGIQAPANDGSATGLEGNDFMDGGAGKDTLSYETTGEAGIEAGIQVTLKQVHDGSAPALELTTDVAGVDRAVSIETIKLTSQADQAIVPELPDPLGFNVVIDGGDAPNTTDGRLGDVLDFSSYTTPVYIDYARTNIVTDQVGLTSAPYAVEIYKNFDPVLQWGQFIWNAFIPSGEPQGQGVKDGTGLRFTNFEYVKGSEQDDKMGLYRLSPGGELTAEQRQALDAARSVSVTLGSDPATAGAAMDARMEQARLIPQNQQDVVIEGGAGKDMIVGTETGVDHIYGGEGNDQLEAGGFVSQVYGGAGIDKVEGGGFKSQLYGGDGTAPDDSPNIFALANHSFAMDATTKDFATWGPFLLTGGVQQWWMEEGWAYWSPFSSLASAIPLAFLDVFGALALTLDAPTMSTVRYALTDSNQLIVQFGGPHGGQAVVENYNINLDTGAATGHIVVFKQELGHGSLDDMRRGIVLARMAGFGGEPSGTDPLVLDLKGDGLELTRRDDSNIYFDVDHDGFAERTAWVGSGDGLLARDLNGNGKIDDVTELFGNATTAGFTALATLDSNSDGKIDAADSAFGSLLVWRDLNANGVTDPGELKTLAETGITEISLASSAPAVSTIHGSTIRAVATFTRTDGTTSTIADVALDNSQTDSRYLGDATISSAAALPNLKGFGNVTDLAVAMTNDASLLGAVAAFKNLPASTGWSALEAGTVGILFRWAQVDTVAATPMGGGVFDQQKLAFLEKYFGEEMTPRDTNGQPSDVNVTELIASWNDVLSKAAIRLGAQGPLHAIFADLPYDVSGDQFVAAGPTTLADAYRAAIAQLSSMPSAALADWTTNWGPALAAYTNALLRHDNQAIRTDFAVQSLVRAFDGTTPALTLTQLVAGLAFTGVQIGTDGNDTLARGSATGLQV